MMDIKYNFSLDPEFPEYISGNLKTHQNSRKKTGWIDMPGGIIFIGHNSETFCYDNELPFHRVLLRDYRIADRLITNEEYIEFIEAGGYQQAEWWLSDGWDYIQAKHWLAPLYWKKINGEWYIFSLSGLHKIALDEPVVHVSYFESDAFARWYGARLPSEMEWEYFASSHLPSLKDANFLDNGIYHPKPQINTSRQIYGDVWEWTSSPYIPYPGYQPLPGILGEYNGKFMNNQMVLRGGSCVTPASHIRPTYRNFFAPDKRWQFSGIRLASDI
jgi:ergothioneine biosynthesis protein EgtB